jgi:hypothetical protein
LCKFFDANQNPVKLFKEDDVFDATFQGNNITEIQLQVQRNDNNLVLTLKPEHERTFSLYVAASNYTITLTHTQKGT